jgi:hypothetical protein
LKFDFGTAHEVEKGAQAARAQPATAPDVDVEFVDITSGPIDFSQRQPLLTGQHLVDFFTLNGAAYTPNALLAIHPQDPHDARYTLTQSSEDREQLFMALFPTIHQCIHVCPSETFAINLTSYATAFNQLVDQYTHARYQQEPHTDMNPVAQTLEPLVMWMGPISDFDLTFLALPERMKEFDRDMNKKATTLHELSQEFREKGTREGISYEGVILEWPGKITVTAMPFGEGWGVQLVDYEG